MKSGSTLAHYQVAEMIGKGGMGEVYRARDTKLDRDVALKILPSDFASDSDRMARFDREAKLLASLHHPNIASIFGFESTDDCTFLVMEMVEGEDLSEELRSGPLPVEEAIDVARQIAEGLEEAHEKGIVHRDLKPANVKRTPDGKVKILDFGLARVFAGESTGEEVVASAPTLTAPMTQIGTVMGTAAYMSPEQARGKEVDRRADIWAFGVILFEMLTGKQLFMGETASDTLAGILKSEPEWDQLPDGLPFQVERVLRRCLAKEPRQRLRDIGEARVRLEDPFAESGMFTGMVTPVTDAGRSGGLVRWLPWALLAASLAVLGWLQFGGTPGADPVVEHLAVPGPDEAEFHIGGSFPGLPTLSPDGSHVAFSARSADDNVVRLYVRDLKSPQSRVFAGTEDAQYPFWSPDGRWIAYYVRTTGLMRISVDGGPPQRIADAGNGKSGAWNEEGDILFMTDYNKHLRHVKDTGGVAKDVTDLKNDEGFNSHRHPQFMPDGRHFLYFARGNGRVASEIRYASLDGGAHKVVTQSSLMGRYASGYLVYVSHGDLVAQPFDPSTGEMSGSPAPLVSGVMTIPGAATGVFSLSDNGRLIYLEGEVGADGYLAWRDRAGRELEAIGDKARYDLLQLSPDNRLAAVGIITEVAGSWDIWIVDLDRKFRTRFTVDPADDFDMVWSANSRGLYFVSDRDGQDGVYYKEIGSPDQPRKIFADSASIRLWDVTDDERTLIYSTAGEGTEYDLWRVEATEGAEPQLLRATATNDVRGRLSPDEKWLGFASSESGNTQVYVAPWPAMAPVTQVSTTTGSWFEWCRDGTEIIFGEESGRLMSVSVEQVEDRLSFGLPEPLFEVRSPVLDGADWAASSDGERFLTIMSQISGSPTYCNLVLNWPEIVKPR